MNNVSQYPYIQQIDENKDANENLTQFRKDVLREFAEIRLITHNPNTVAAQSRADIVQKNIASTGITITSTMVDENGSYNGKGETTIAVTAGTYAPFTHKLLSSTHDDTTAGTVVRGDMIVGNSTPKWARVALGTNGYFWKSDGTDAKWAAHGLTAADVGAASGSATLNYVPICIDSTGPVYGDSPIFTNGTGIAVGTTTFYGTILQLYGVNRTAFQAAMVDIRSSDTYAIDKGGSISFGGKYNNTDSMVFASISGRKQKSTLNGLEGYFAISTSTSAGPLTEKLRIIDTGYLGLGLTGPSEILSANGRLALAKTTDPTATANYGKLWVSSTSPYPLRFMDSAGNSNPVVVGGGTANRLPTYTSTYIIGDSNIYTNGDNIAICDAGADPDYTYKLLVKETGTTGIATSVFIQNSNSVDGNWSGEKISFGYVPHAEYFSSRIVGYQRPANLYSSRLQLQTHKNTETEWWDGIFLSENGTIGIGTTAVNEMATIYGRLSLLETTAPTATSSYGKLWVSSTDKTSHFLDSSGNDRILCSYRGSLSSAPTSNVAAGDLYYNTGDSKVYIYANSGWVALT